MKAAGELVTVAVYGHTYKRTSRAISIV